MGAFEYIHEISKRENHEDVWSKYSWSREVKRKKTKAKGLKGICLKVSKDWHCNKTVLYKSNEYY